ncbi:hypothetical protein F4803DRAFT_571725 [Xylaria telfairii]|nr:hypothetical protein F4803DRAFT_571725 [Xylaria telfairii]
MPYAVDSFHINVAVGDCAIHLLVEESMQTKRPIKAAVLIDAGTKSGGKKTKNGQENSAFRRMLQYIQTSPAYGIQLQFDTVVISHWDEDHYGNLRQALREDLVWSLSKKLPYLKYENNGTPATYFYAPNVGGKQGHNGPDYSSEDPNDPTLEGNIDNMQVRTYIRLQPDGTKIKVDLLEVKSGGTFYPVGLFRCATDQPHRDRNVLGVNFFNNRRVNEVIRDNEPYGVGDLLRDNPAKAGDYFSVPGIYCIGVNQQTFPNGKPTTQVIPETVTKTNRVSIASVVLWDDGSDDKQEIRCSHYSAGDADDANENKFFGWLFENGIHEVTTVKLSHHGSRSSTPSDMFKLNPRNVVISNPKNRFFHPSWEVMFWFCLEARRYPNIHTKFLALKYPFFLDAVKGKFKLLEKIRANPNGRHILNLEAFDLPKYEWFQSEIKNVNKAMDTMSVAGFENEFDAYESAKDKSVADGMKYILSTLVAYWEQHCYPRPSAHDYPVGADAKDVLINEFVYIISRPHRMGDGESKFKTLKSSVLTTPKSYSQNMTAKESQKLVSGFPKGVPKLSKTVVDAGMPTKKLKTGRKRDLKLLSDDDNDDEGVYSPNIYKNKDFDRIGENENELDQGVVVLMDDQPPDDKPQLEGDGRSAALHRTKPKQQILTIPQTRQKGPRTIIPHDEDTAFYLLCSLIPEDGPMNRHYKLLESDPWDWFLSTSGGGVMRLEQNPTLGGSEVVRLVNDEIGNWFADALGAYDIALIKPADKSKPGIGGFQMTVRIPRTDASGNPAPFVVIDFTTEESILRRTFGELIPPMGLRDGSTMLTLAAKSGSLAPASMLEPPTIDLIDVAKYLELEDTFKSPFLQPLHRLSFTFAQNGGLEGQRNAIWFVPQQAFRVVTRLEWDLESEQKQKILDFLEDFGAGLTKLDRGPTGTALTGTQHQKTPLTT